MFYHSLVARLDVRTPHANMVLLLVMPLLLLLLLLVMMPLLLLLLLLLVSDPCAFALVSAAFSSAAAVGVSATLQSWCLLMLGVCDAF